MNQYQKTILRAYMAIACVWLAWAAFGCGEKIQPGNRTGAAGRTFKAATAVAALTSRPIVYEAVGTITARTRATLAAKIMGTVTAVHVRESDRVSEGQLLIEIDPRTVAAQRKQAEAGLAEAKKAYDATIAARDSAASMAELAKATYQRYVQLMKNESASRQEFDEVTARYRQAEAGLAQARAMVEATAEKVRQAEAAVSASRVMDADSRVTAPYDGTITQRFVDPGSLAGPGTPLLAIRSASGYRVDLVIPENLTPFMNQGLDVAIQVPALAHPEMRGTVSTVIPFSDPASHSFVVQVDIPVAAGLQEGQYAKGRFVVGAAERILVPAKALVLRGQLTGVYWIDPERTARFRLVRTGNAEGDDIEVISGLRPGDRYVVEPGVQITDGMKVEG